MLLRALSSMVNLEEFLVLLLHGSQGLVGLSVEVGLNLGLVPSVLDPFLSYKNLLDSLHKSDKGIPCKIEKEERMEMAP